MHFKKFSKLCHLDTFLAFLDGFNLLFLPYHSAWSFLRRLNGGGENRRPCLDPALGGGGTFSLELLSKMLAVGFP